MWFMSLELVYKGLYELGNKSVRGERKRLLMLRQLFRLFLIVVLPYLSPSQTPIVQTIVNPIPYKLDNLLSKT